MFNVIVMKALMALKFSRVEAKNKLDPSQKMLVRSLEALTLTQLQMELQLPLTGSLMRTDSSLLVSTFLLLPRCLITSSRCSLISKRKNSYRLERLELIPELMETDNHNYFDWQLINALCFLKIFNSNIYN